MMSAPVRRSGGDLDVYTGLLFAATIVLAVGITAMVMSNLKQAEPVSVKGASLQTESALLGLPGFELVK